MPKLTVKHLEKIKMCFKQINQRLVNQILSFVKHKQSRDLWSPLAKQWKLEANKEQIVFPIKKWEVEN